MGSEVKRALLVGIDHYRHFSDLGGCVNDARALESLMARNEDDTRNFDCKLQVGAVAREQLLDDVQALLAGGADFAFLYFAGHGVGIGDDVALATSDGQGYTPGVRFGEVLEQVKASEVKEVMVILDCCFSGGAGTVTALDRNSAVLRTGVSILTASRSDQTSVEFAGRGLFSGYLEGGLSGGAADVLGHVTVAGLYAYLSESFGAWDQRPTFKANVDRLHYLRQCKPAVPLQTLRELPDWFPEADSVFPLDPSYEPDAEPANSEHEGIFAKLQKCRASKLVEPDGHEHMYYAAMNSLGCRLTPLGKHYWQLAKQEYL